MGGQGIILHSSKKLKEIINMKEFKYNAVDILRPEERALVLFARQDLCIDDVLEFEILFDQDFNYDYFLQIAKEHGIAPIIGYYMQSNETIERSLKHVDEKFKRHLGLYYLFARSHSKRMYNELDRLKLLFDEHGIKFVVLKGPGLAKSVYRVPGTRIFGDLDLLVSPSDVYKAHNILINDGYTAYGFQGQHIPQEEVVERMESDFHLYPYGKNNFAVELHQYGGEYEIDLSCIYHGAIEVKLCNQLMLIPNEIDFFIHACAHFVQHRKQAKIPVLNGLDIKNNIKQLMDIRELYIFLRGREESLRERINFLGCHEVISEAIAITERFYGKFSSFYPDITCHHDMHYWYAENWESHFERRFFSGEEERLKIIEKSREQAVGKKAFKCFHKKTADKKPEYKIPSIYANEKYLKYLLEETQNMFSVKKFNPRFNMSWDARHFYITLQISSDSLNEPQAYEFGYQLLFGFQDEFAKVVFIKPLQSGEHRVFLWQENYDEGRYIEAKVQTFYEQGAFKINAIIPWNILSYKPQRHDKLFFDVTIRTAKESLYHEEHIVSWSTGRYFLAPWADKCDHSIINSIELVG